MAKPLRETMPAVAGFIDEMRDAFGTEAINDSIKAGMAGQPTFYASENGVEVGTKDLSEGVKLSEMQKTGSGAIVTAWVPFNGGWKC